VVSGSDGRVQPLPRCEEQPEQAEPGGGKGRVCLAAFPVAAGGTRGREKVSQQVPWLPSDCPDVPHRAWEAGLPGVRGRFWARRVPG